jgi:hypothetical protein
MKKEYRRLVQILMVFLFALSARPRTTWADDPCILDRANLCGSVEPGQGRVLNCMESKSDLLSPACQKIVSQTDAQVTKVRAACAIDIQRYCADQPPDPNARIACLKNWTNQMTSDCLEGYKKLLSLPYQPDF